MKVKFWVLRVFQFSFVNHDKVAVFKTYINVVLLRDSETVEFMSCYGNGYKP